MKSKKGQFYLLTAVILISVLFSIIQTSKINLSSSKLMESNTKKLYENEAKIVINNAVYDNKNITIELETYTNNYIKYKQEKNEKINLIYLFKENNQLWISNKFKDNITMFPQNITIENNKYLSINNSLLEINISHNENKYLVQFDNYDKEFRSIIIEEK